MQAMVGSTPIHSRLFFYWYSARSCMENPVSPQDFRTFIDRIFVIEDVTEGSQKVGYLTRYRGHLREIDSIQAYAQLSEQLKPYNITPLFRKDGERQSILLTSGVLKPKDSNIRVNLILFILTAISVLITGGLNGIIEPLPGDLNKALKIIIVNGWPFAVSMLTILSAHELGHYFMGRHYGIKVTLPYFIPLPLSPFGTMGAVINMKEPPKNKRQLMDIGIAGPLSGLVVAIPVLALGLHLSKIDTIHKLSAIQLIPTGNQFIDFLNNLIFSNPSMMMEGNNLLYLFLKYISFGRLLPTPISFNGLNPFIYWIKYFFTGMPFPLGGTDVMIHPVAWAGWAGLLITSLNLIPAGQLDGGHMIYTLFGKVFAKKLQPFILILLVLLGFAWNGWWLWAVIIFFFGRLYAEPFDQITELDGKRKVLAIFSLILFVLIFTPVPLIIPV
jgi:membrane-associated protease RseP (regulator of RpoE activity)